MNTESEPELDLSSLSIHVYEELKRRLNAGTIRPGQFIDLSALGRELGMSRTPLRDAMIRLEIEGFVTVYPRRGVMVRALDIAEVRAIYQIIGALESSVVERIGGVFKDGDAERMDALEGAMRSALDADDFDSFYSANLAFHDVYLDLSDNGDLVRHVRILKERLYDFPRKSSYVKEWELASNAEHGRIATLLRARDFTGAAAFIREVHWRFEEQEGYIRRYYLASGGSGR